MPAPAINVGTKFSVFDGLHIVYVPVIVAATLIPTRAEIDAGDDLTTEISSWDGFMIDPQTIDTPSLARFVGNIPGRIQITAGVLTMYTDQDGDDVGDILPTGTSGFILWMDQGDVAAKTMDVWPVRVNRLSKERSMENATLWKVAFTHNQLPVEGITIPAHA